jgi:hypothetical protein
VSEEEYDDEYCELDALEIPDEDVPDPLGHIARQFDF